MNARPLIEAIAWESVCEAQLELFKAADVTTFEHAPERGHLAFRLKKDDDYHGLYRYEMTSKERLAGFVDFIWPRLGDSRLRMELVWIAPEFRGRGLGMRLYKAFFGMVRKRFPAVTAVIGEVCSQGITKLQTRALQTEPTFYDTGTGNDISREDAMQRLPKDSPEDAEGRLDGPMVGITHPLRKRKRRIDSE